MGLREARIGLTRRAVLAGGLIAMTSPARAAVDAYLVPVELDGRPARLLLDTGAARSVLTLAAVRRLGLVSDGWVGTLLRGAGGRLESHANADVEQARASGRSLYQRPGQALSFSVTAQAFGAADGLLGGDILRHFDIAADAAGAVALYPPGGGGGATATALTPLFPDLLLAPVVLDGHALTALLDTGAQRSLLNARGLHKIGPLPPGAPGTIAAIGGGSAVRSHRFRQLSVGALNIDTPTLLAAAVPEAAFDLILGMDVLGRQGFRLSYSRRCLFLPG